VAQAEEGAAELLLVGHNPGMEELLELLTGEVRRMPTAALARIQLDIDKWAKLRERTGRLEWHVKAKEL
ncbi:MAG: histidine phosphatase family protein, partial [Acidobacteriota bacterium]|nr:histidine phosphatase family protein [Acidobacteriota bacterium]